MLAKIIPQDFDVATFAKAALPSFVRGVAVVVGLYLLLFVVGLLRGGSVMESLEADLASETVAIEVAEVAQEHHEDEEAHKPVVFDMPVSGESLKPAPFDGLIEEHASGNLPRIGDDGLAPFDAYRRSVDLPDDGRPIVAFGVMDYGLSKSLSQKALKNLAPHVSFLASVYAEDPDHWVDFARRGGHEVWLHVPFETQDYPAVDSGPLTLLKRSSLRLNQDRLYDVLARTRGYTGLWGEIDETFKEADTTLKGFFDSIFSRGLGYLEVGEFRSKRVADLAKSYRMPYLRSTVVIDGGKAADRQKAFQEALQHAMDYGWVIILVPPTPAAMGELPKWIADLEAKGVSLVPVSAIYGYDQG